MTFSQGKLKKWKINYQSDVVVVRSDCSSNYMVPNLIRVTNLGRL